MSIIRVMILAGGVASLVAGCDSFRGAQEPIESPATLVAAVTKDYSTEVAVAKYYSLGPSERREYRDKVVALRLIAIDARYQAFIQELRGARAGVGLGGDIITLILAGLGTLVADTTAKTVFAAGTAVIAGTRISFDKHLFYNQTLPAIISQMDAARSTQLLTIRRSLATPAENYSLPEAMVDLVELERQGSIETAIKKITGAATEDAKTADANLRAFQRNKDFVSVDMTKLRSALLDKVLKFDNGMAIMKAAQISGGSSVFTTGDAARQYLTLKIRFETGDLAALQKLSDALQ